MATVEDALTNRPKLPIYLDYQATTPVDPRVLKLMLPYFSEKFGNPGSATHSFGREAAAACERAREQVAAVIGAEAREIVFTSGATESNNIAIKGAGYFARDGRRHIVTAATEHKCVLESCKALAAEGFRLTVLPVEANGLVDLARLAAALSDDTLLVSIMAVNNEIGVIQPLAEIGELCRRHGAYFHTDAAQAAGKIPLDVDGMAIDLMSISGHKLYGPKGVGALYVRRRPRVRLAPLMSGGGQERGLRSGTLPAALCVGLGAASEISAAEMAAEGMRLKRLRERLRCGLAAKVPGIALNGDLERRIPGNLNLAFPGVDAEVLMARLKDIAVSSGSACTSASIEPSYVLRALGLEDALARASLRIGLGRFTDSAEIDYAVEAIAAAVDQLRREAPRADRPAAAQRG
ncbi:MAG TPA: IscS subfamily cysteine desulfurase [Alphaproteobacteria bacterium]|nr:IscS subfamily cysteine desulfurase [Alphaproteobacteria bacterium]